MGVQIAQGEGAIFEGCLGYSTALAIFAAATLRHSLQKGSFNRQYCHAAEGIIQYARQAHIAVWKFLGEAMRPISREGGGVIAERGWSLISTIALLCLI